MKISKLASLPALGIALAVFSATSAWADQPYWQNSGTGEFQTASNWYITGNPGGIPTSGSSISTLAAGTTGTINYDSTTVIALGATYSINAFSGFNNSFSLTAGELDANSTSTFSGVSQTPTLTINGGTLAGSASSYTFSSYAVNLQSGTFTVVKSLATNSSLNVSGGTLTTGRVLDIQNASTMVVTGNTATITTNATNGTNANGMFWLESGGTLKEVFGSGGITPINIKSNTAGASVAFTLAGALQVDLSGLSLTADNSTHPFTLIDASYLSTAKYGVGAFSGFNIVGTANSNVSSAYWSFSNSSLVQANPGGVYKTVYLDVITVPEPATWALLAFSLTTVMVLRRRRRD